MRRPLFLVAVVAAAGIAYACGFPDVDFRSEGSTDGGPDSSPAGSSSSSGGDGGDHDGGVTLDAGDLQVIVDGSAFDANFDAGSKIDAAAGCYMCDCDGDGFLNNDAGCNPPDGKLDCDDLDSRTHPGAGPYSFDAEAPRFGDWNCTAGVEKIPTDGFNCDTIPSTLIVGGCKAQGGFTDTVECGQKGTYVTCKDPLVGLGNCTTDKVGTATQLCQ